MPPTKFKSIEYNLWVFVRLNLPRNAPASAYAGQFVCVIECTDDRALELLAEYNALALTNVTYMANKLVERR